jgi:hypothetical protein
MGIYTITVQKLEKIHEVKGRFWIKAEFREHEDIWTTYDLPFAKSDHIEVLLTTYNIPKTWHRNENGTYQAFWTGGFNRTITKEQYYILKRVIWKYLIYSDHCDLLTQEAHNTIPNTLAVNEACVCAIQ